VWCNSMVFERVSPQSNIRMLGGQHLRRPGFHACMQLRERLISLWPEAEWFLVVQATVSGRPGAAYVDVPSDVLFAEASPQDIPQLSPVKPLDHSQPSPFLHKPSAPAPSIKEAVRLLSQAQR